jgi:acetoin utilization deacetylase AcuC-like enzyme
MLPIFYSDVFLEHQTGLGHPEKPGRLTAIKTALEASAIASQLDWRLPTPLDLFSPLPLLNTIHNPAYIQAVQHLAEAGGGYIDSDTPLSERSYEVALLAVNAWLDGVKSVVQSHHPAFVLARPPGHHALPEHGMGFCIFANAAIAALYAINELSLNRVAILDWDVHHGNGTQAIVEHDPQIFYCSLHQSPCYPGTGTHQETGDYENVLNLPMPPGSIGKDYQAMFEQHIIPFLTRIQPDLLIVSAGYDANAADPLADINLQPEDFGALTRSLVQLTSSIVFGLEGGYDFDALAQSVLMTLAACI